MTSTPLRKTPEVSAQKTLPLGFCPVDQESGAHTTQQTGSWRKNYVCH